MKMCLPSAFVRVCWLRVCLVEHAGIGAVDRYDVEIAFSLCFDDDMLVLFVNDVCMIFVINVLHAVLGHEVDTKRWSVRDVCECDCLFVDY